MKKFTLMLSTALILLSLSACFEEDEVSVNNFSTLIFHSDLDWPGTSELFPVDDADGGVYAMAFVTKSPPNHVLNGQAVSMEGGRGYQLVRLASDGRYLDHHPYTSDGFVPVEIATAVDDKVRNANNSQYDGYARKTLADGSVIEVKDFQISKTKDNVVLWINTLDTSIDKIRNPFIDVDDAGNTYIVASDRFVNDGTSLISNYGDYVSIYKFDTDGEQVWSKEIRPFGGQESTGRVYAGGIVVGEDALYIAGYGTMRTNNLDLGFLRKYSLADGSMIWEQEPRAEDNSTYDHYYYFFPQALTVDNENNVWVSFDWSFSDWSVSTIPHGTPELKIYFGNNVIEGNTYTNNVTYHLLAKFAP